MRPRPETIMTRGDISAVVLAAGLSSRMKRFKPLLELGGRTVIERVISSCRAAGVEPLVVTGHETARLEPLLARLGVGWVVNPRYEEEMLVSVQTGAAALHGGTQAFFLHPGDLPFVRASTLTQMIEAWSASGIDAVRPRFRGRGGHPVLIGASRVPEIISYRGEGGLRNLMRDEGWEIFDAEVDDPGILTDLDTPEDYERALKEVRLLS